MTRRTFLTLPILASVRPHCARTAEFSPQPRNPRDKSGKPTDYKRSACAPRPDSDNIRRNTKPTQSCRSPDDVTFESP